MKNKIKQFNIKQISSDLPIIDKIQEKENEINNSLSNIFNLTDKREIEKQSKQKKIRFLSSNRKVRARTLVKEVIEEQKGIEQNTNLIDNLIDKTELEINLKQIELSNQENTTFNIYTDGSAEYPNLINSFKKDYNQLPYCKFAYLITDHQGKNIITYKSEISRETNNRMELKAIIRGIKYLIRDHESSNVIKTINLFADSEYSLNTLFIWYFSWKQNKIIHNKKNIDLIEEEWIPVVQLLQEKHIKLNAYWLPSHTGSNNFYAINNDLVDKLCIIRKQDMLVNNNQFDKT
jgi:ribonuclease HI